jgi:3',5'-cyclic AMP phosphodiesterase CpdA
MSLRLAHFSDFHLSRLNGHFYRSLALVDDAIRQDINHLIITGDVVESGQMAVLEAFTDALKERGWASAARLTIIPGNHDIFPVSFRALPSLRTPTWNFEKFAELTRRSRTGAGVIKLQRGNHYPFGKVLSKDAVLVGVDTTRNGQSNPLRWAEGELPERQRIAVTKFFSKHAQAKHRIVAMHHHPWEEEFEEGWLEKRIGGIQKNFTTPPANEIKSWLRNCGATLVLCGHVHALDGIAKRQIGKKCQVLRSGTAGGVDDADESGDRLRIYHLIDLGSDGKTRCVCKKRWDSQLDG